MLKYTIKRIIGVIPTLIIVVTFVFFFVRLIPGDPARLVAGPQATQADVEVVREELGLNKPLVNQYADYVVGLLHGDLGTSLRTKRPVALEVSLRYMNTVKLTVFSLTWSVIVGVLLGVWSGKNRSKWQDYTGMTLAISGISMPSFWIGFLLIMVFAVNLGWFPTTGADSWKSFILPGIALGTSIAAIIARFTRSSIIEVMKEDYIRTARAKGLREKTVIWKHAFRNAMISVVTVVGLQFGFLLGGSVVTETVFAFPGLGSLLVESVNYRDYNAIQSLILIFSLHFIVINLVVDILYALLNPEIKLVSLTGGAGTGKTLLALAAALEQERDFEQIILSRPTVILGNQEIGFLPGDQKTKMGPFVQPLMDNLNVIRHCFKPGSKQALKIDEMLKDEKLLISPLAYIRGRSLGRVFFIVDEAQNLTPHEIKTIITRAGEDTKIVFTGDIFQIDQPYLDMYSNGLTHLGEKMAGQPLFEHVNLTKGERSELSEIASRLL